MQDDSAITGVPAAREDRGPAAPVVEAGGVAIIGAGSVGTTIAYSIMLQGLASRITLVDVNQAKCEAEVKDLVHGLRFVPSVRVRAGQLADCSGAEIVIVTAGAKQKSGQTRLDLAQTNVEMFRRMVPALAAAAPAAVVLVVSNPVDVLTYAAGKLHPGGHERVIGSGTVLDSSRFVTLIAERIGVNVRNVHAQIVGEHGESELPLWSSAHVANVPLDRFEPAGRGPLTFQERREIVERVRGAAGEIIAAKGATNWAIGLAAARIVEAIRRDEHAILTVSRHLEDFHDISDVCLSVPCVVNRRGARPLRTAVLSDLEHRELTRSADIVRQAARAAGL
ncbi:MAG: L-lactate dehydrogenase [Planctomycetes bacterium]|nr:L-lactate dehydrogenase [Planctomycetota bacterium]